MNKKLSLLESELQNCIEIETKQIQIDYDKILKSLNEIVDFSNSKMDRELLQRFIAKVVPNGENHFIWYLNLDGKSDTQLNVDIVGNKKNALVSIDESGDTSPLHTSDILYFNDKKSFAVETLLRLLLQKWTNRLKQLFVFQIIYSKTKPVGTLAPTGFYFVKN